MAVRAADRKLSAFVLFAALVSIITVHGPIIGYKAYANVDEAYASAIAARLLDGAKLYEGAISQRGPLMYYFFEAIGFVHGWDNIVALRVYALALALGHVLLVHWAARALFSREAAIIATIVAGYALAFGFPPEDGVAVNGEPLQLPFLLSAVVVGAYAMRSRKRRLLLLALAGVLFGAAASIKQSALVHPAPLVLWIIADAHRQRRKWTEAAFEVATISIASLVVPLILVVHAAAQGTLASMYYYTVVYNRDVHLQPTSKPLQLLVPLFFRLTGQTTFFIVTAILTGVAVPWVLKRLRAVIRLRSFYALLRSFGVRTYITLHFLCAVVTATTMWRFFPHYYVQAAPFMAILVGVMLEPALRRRALVHVGRAAVTTFACFVMGVSAMACYFNEKIDGRVAHDESVQLVGHLVQKTTKPEDRIFVWGFSSWVYGYSHRRPAGRYVFETYVTGFVPWYWQDLDIERARIVPGSVEALLDDLERERPAVVIDAGSVMMARSMRTYEKPARFLHAHYCFELRIGAFDVYRRKADDAVPCSVPWFPRPNYAVDYLGRGLPLPMPLTVDLESTRKLPQGDFFMPIYFLDAPPPPRETLEAGMSAKRVREYQEGAEKGFFIQGLEP